MFALFASLLVVGAVGSGTGCSSTSVAPEDAGPPIGSFGCCPDAKPMCGRLISNGPKASADDNCIYGYDGTVPDPNQEGWTRTTDKYGCAIWTPPPNPKMSACGVAPDRPEWPDAGGDAGDGGDASFQDAGPDAADSGSD